LTPRARSAESATLGMEKRPAARVSGSAMTKGAHPMPTQAATIARLRQRCRGAHSQSRQPGPPRGHGKGRDTGERDGQSIIEVGEVGGDLAPDRQGQQPGADQQRGRGPPSGEGLPGHGEDGQQDRPQKGEDDLYRQPSPLRSERLEGHRHQESQRPDLQVRVSCVHMETASLVAGVTQEVSALGKVVPRVAAAPGCHHPPQGRPHVQDPPERARQCGNADTCGPRREPQIRHRFSIESDARASRPEYGMPAPSVSRGQHAGAHPRSSHVIAVVAHRSGRQRMLLESVGVRLAQLSGP